MSDVTVLDFLTRELKGRILTVSSISAFVAAEKAADKLGMTATSREAAELAVLLPKAPLEGIRAEFGPETAEIVEALRARNSYSSVSIEAMGLHGSSGTDGNRRDAAIAACAAEVAVASPERRVRMAEMLGLMADRETDAKRSAFLKDLRTQLPSPALTDPEAESRRASKVISISMDVCGSTEAKARMRACARDEEELHEWYEWFHREFLSLECLFYTQLFQAVQGEIEWDWRNAFVVKGIGDEVWLLFEIPGHDLWKLPSLIARLLHAALTVAKRLIHWTSAPDDVEKFAAGTWETRHLPLKFYVDLLEDAFEVSGPRRDFVMERMPQILGPRKAGIARTSSSLGTASMQEASWETGDAWSRRSEPTYIGWEVDRFFRATKYALPGVVTVGRALFKRAFGLPQHPDEHVGCTNLMRTILHCRIQQQGSGHIEHCFRYVPENVPPKELKGVGEGYTVYRGATEERPVGPASHRCGQEDHEGHVQGHHACHGAGGTRPQASVDKQLRGRDAPGRLEAVSACHAPQRGEAGTLPERRGIRAAREGARRDSAGWLRDPLRGGGDPAADAHRLPAVGDPEAAVGACRPGGGGAAASRPQDWRARSAAGPFGGAVTGGSAPR